MSQYISPQGLEHLKKYKYASGLYGFIDLHIMTPFWNWAVNLLPMWLAPNLVTLLSLFHCLATYLVFQYYAPELHEAAPRWTYFFYIYCGFMYQTLDAIDGKQARRTGSSSPLGQLFDHGCDAVCAIFTGLICAGTLRLGSNWMSLLALMLCMVPFYCSNWEEAQTHTMRFGVLGVTEGQFTVMLLHLVTGIYGPELWVMPVYQDWEMRHVVVSICMFGVFSALYTSILEVVVYFRKQDSFVGEVTEGPKAAAWQMAQFLGFVATSSAWILTGEQPLMNTHPRLALMTMGFIFAFLTSRLIICHVTNTPYERVYKVLYPLPLLIVNNFLSKPLIAPEYLAVWYFLGVVFVYFHFVISVINEITTYLNISCFTITPVVKKD